MLYLTVAEAQRDARVRVMDMSGRVVLDAPVLNLNAGSVATLDMSRLQSGQYAVQLSTADWTRTQRVEVTR